jgi:hypothetical protein
MTFGLPRQDTRDEHRYVNTFRNINRIPFRHPRPKDKLSPLTFRAFARDLGPTDPRSTAVHVEPFSTSVFKDLT